jgi:ABC-2 type transport system ATP-binding protein
MEEPMQLDIQQISKSFGSNLVLDKISLQAESGKAVGLLGRNGAGKTTAIRIIMGVFGPDSGQVLLDGKPINRDRITIGYLPEERGLYPKKVILEQLIYFGMLKGMKKADAKASAERWAAKMEMSDTLNRRLDTLSKGNQQKIQLVATLIANPQIIILDEPFSGLDPVNAMMLKDIVKEQIEDNKIVLFSSHQMNYIEEFCDDIAILNGGSIVLSGNIGKIKRSYDRTTILISSTQLSKIQDQIDYPSRIKDDQLWVKLNNEAEKGDLLIKLAQLQVDIDEIKVFEPSLNDIFVEYTEGRI